MTTSNHSMIHELRLYRVAPGRLSDIHDRFQHHLPGLLNRHGIKIAGRWTVVSGSDLPLFVYVMTYSDLAERERSWRGLLNDEEWPKLRAATNAGSEMVERTAIWFLRTSDAWQPDAETANQRLGGVHELVIQRVAMGQKAATENYLRTVYLAVMVEAGARVMMVAEAISGSDLPQYVMMFAWPDAQSRHVGRLCIDSAPRIIDAVREQRSSIGRALLERAALYVLEPAKDALPLAALGRTLRRSEK